MMKPGTFVPKQKKAVAALALACILAACPGSDPVAPASQAAPPEPSEVNPQILLYDNIPQPGSYTAEFGESVVWRNAGSNDHSVSTYGTPDEWKDTLLKPGEDFRHTFSATGEFAYICVVHGEVGSVIVVDNDYEDGFDQP